jgi:CLIP-associating protein 1/2
VEKLGDSKERNRTVALNGILDVYKNCPQEVETKIKEFGLGNKTPRIRQEAVKWLVHVHSTTPGFPFRGYVPSLMVMLEDASEPVRETAKEAVVELFRFVV